MGATAPTVYQYGTRDFFEIDEKIGGGGVVENLQRSKGCGQKYLFMPSTSTALATPLTGRCACAL